MEPKNLPTHKLNSSNIKDISSYCKLNNIDDVDSFVNKCFKRGYDIEVYGFLGKTGIVGEKQVEIEVIREIRVEVPVEVIKEVEKIVEKIIEVPVEVEKTIEVPVDRIVEVIKEIPVEKVVIKEVIKEIPVETVVTKIEYISDNTQINELLLKIQQLESKPPEIIETIKEVPVDRIVIQEKIVEVPVDKIVIQEKVVEVDKPNDKSKLLEVTLQNLRKELSLKNETIKDLENKNKQLESVNIDRGAVYMKGSNITQNM
jgi:hypothetical protein